MSTERRDLYHRVANTLDEELRQCRRVYATFRLTNRTHHAERTLYELRERVHEIEESGYPVSDEQYDWLTTILHRHMIRVGRVNAGDFRGVAK